MSSAEPIPAAPAYCWVDGVAASTVPTSDRGLQFGDGLFETFVVQAGERPGFAAHRERLRVGCQRLDIPALDWPALEACMDQVLKPIPGQWVAKLIVTRGSSPRGYRIPSGITPRWVLSLQPWPEFPLSHWDEGVVVRLCTLTLAHQPALAGLKHLNRLENVLARAEWSDPTIHEGLLLDQTGRLVEGTSSNLFALCNGVVRTHDLAGCGVAGVMRAWVLKQLQAQDIPCRQEGLSPAELRQAEEVWLCNSVYGIWPVRSLSTEPQQHWGRGPLTARLQEQALRELPWIAPSDASA